MLTAPTKASFISRIKKHTLRYLLLRFFEWLRLSTSQLISLAYFRSKCLVYGVKCGKNTYVYGNVIIRGPGQIIIGDNVQLISSSWRSSASSLAHGVKLRTFHPPCMADNKIIIEDGAGLGGTSITARSRTIRIGKNTMFGPDCMVMDSDFHKPWPPTIRSINPGFEDDQDVVIGNNVWIGARCIILKGVTIGDNAVIASGSIVVKNIPPNALAGGNPAKVIKFYSDESERQTDRFSSPLNPPKIQ